jgi:tetratricopeptide (TPR) repeat protein
MKPKFTIAFTILSLSVPGIFHSGCSSYERKNTEKLVCRINDTILPVEQRFMLLAELGQKAIQQTNNTMLRRDYARLLLSAGFASPGLKIYRDEMLKYPEDKELHAKVVNAEIACMMVAGDNGSVTLTAGEEDYLRELDTIRFLSERIAASPSDPGLYFKRGNHFLVIDLLNAGMWDLKRSLALDPCFPGALFSVAVMEMRLKKNLESMNTLGQLENCIHEQDMLQKQTWQDFGVFLKALTMTDSMIRQHPDRPDYYIQKASIYMKGKEFELAVSALDEGLKTSPENGEIFAFRAYVQYTAGNQKEALDDLTKAELFTGKTDSELSKKIRGKR